MTRPAGMLIRCTFPLDQLPQNEVEIIRRFLFQHLRGLDTNSDKRWRRMWGAIWRADPDEGHAIAHIEERSGPFHKRHRAILERLFASQERFTNIDRLHDYAKVATGFVDWQEGKRGGAWPKPRSTSFLHCSEDEMREFHEAMVEWLHGERVQRFLFRHVKAAQRQAMLETILSEPEK